MLRRAITAVPPGWNARVHYPHIRLDEHGCNQACDIHAWLSAELWHETNRTPHCPHFEAGGGDT